MANSNEQVTLSKVLEILQQLEEKLNARLGSMEAMIISRISHVPSSDDDVSTTYPVSQSSSFASMSHNDDTPPLSIEVPAIDDENSHSTIVLRAANSGSTDDTHDHNIPNVNASTTDGASQSNGTTNMLETEGNADTPTTKGIPSWYKSSLDLSYLSYSKLLSIMKDASSATPFNQIDVPCVCHATYFPPLLFNNCAHFMIWEANIPQRMQHSHSTVQEYMIIYSLTRRVTLRRKKITGIKQCICSIFEYSKQVMLFGGERRSGYFKIGLHYLPDYEANSVSWRTEPNSYKALHNLDPNNCICLQYKGKVLAVTITSKSKRVFFHVYFPPTSAVDLQWDIESAFITLKSEEGTCHIQSCVVVMGIAYYVLKYADSVRIYKTDISHLLNSSANRIANIPQPVDLLKDSYALNAYLSVTDEEVIVISEKSVSEKTFIEVRPLRSSPLHPYIYCFSSAVKVVTATIVPEKQRSVAIVYHDPQVNKCKLEIINIEYGD